MPPLRKSPGIASHHEAGQSSLVLLHDVLSQIALAAWITDASFNILFANAALMSAAQLRPGDILGKPTEALLVQNPREFLPSEPAGWARFSGWSGPVTCRDTFRRNTPVVAMLVLPLNRDLPTENIRPEGSPACLFVISDGGAETNIDRVLLTALFAALLHPPANPQTSRLTQRQKSIHRLLQRSYTYKEIASELGVAHSTVRVLVTQIRQRLGAHAIPLLRQNVK